MPETISHSDLPDDPANAFPDALQRHGTQRPVIETAAGTSLFVPDHAAMIRTHRSTKSSIVQRA